VKTEEDGVDEAGRTAQPPLIMTPPSLEADPDGEATDAVVDNDFMAPSRTGTGFSLSGVTQRSNGSSGDSATMAETAAAESADSEVNTTVPLPADTIGQAKARPSSAASVPLAEDATPATMSDRKSSFAPAETASAEPAPTPASSPASASRSGSSYSGSSYSDTGSSYSGTGYSTPPSYTRSEWSTGFGSTTAAPGSSTPSRSATPASVGRTSSSPAPAGPAAPGSAPAGGAGVGSAPSNGYPSSSNGFSSGAASAVGGAAAGLASSVTSAWQNRGSTRGVQARKSAKPTKRQAMLTLARVEPWSVMKFSFVASVVAFVILFVAVAVLYMVLSALGVFDSLQNTVSSITSSQSSAGTNISHWFSASLILGYTAMLGALNIVLITAMCTVGSVVYNLIAKTLGGIEVTLRETD
jgi:hypothetical protein